MTGIVAAPSTTVATVPGGTIQLQELAPAHYGAVVEPLRALAINNLFARAVVEQGAPGRVFAYSADRPAVIYVVHAYGMSLLFGETKIPEVDSQLLAGVIDARRAEDEWLQISGEAWMSRLTRRETSATSCSRATVIDQYTRVNFRFCAKEYAAARRRLSSSCRVERADRAAFAMPGSVVPRAFWRDAERFLDAGAGFAVMIDDEPAALAFSAFAMDGKLEIGIETVPKFRGRGLATHACAALIDDCLARGLEPLWACRLENTASYRLALRLGFEPVRYLPYFRLSYARAG